MELTPCTPVFHICPYIVPSWPLGPATSLSNFQKFSTPDNRITAVATTLLHHPMPAGTVFGLQCLQKSNLVPARSIPGLGRNQGMSLIRQKRERDVWRHGLRFYMANNRGTGGEEFKKNREAGETGRREGRRRV